MEGVKISPKKCKLAMVLAGHHTGLSAFVSSLSFELSELFYICEGFYLHALCATE